MPPEQNTQHPQPNAPASPPSSGTPEPTPPPTPDDRPHRTDTPALTTDLAVIGAGAAGLMAAIAAGRTIQATHGSSPATAVLAIDGARKLGAKILVAGGGRCNVTHHEVTEHAYAGTSRNSIRNVLRRFAVADTLRFFNELGVHFKREDTGKLFPTTDKARTVLDALLTAARDARVTLRHPDRVHTVAHTPEAPHPFTITTEIATIHARTLILATGGMALPRSGSDGLGYTLAKALGHTITPQIHPALVPLVLDESSPLRALSGLTLPVQIELRSGTNKRLETFTNSTLLTHFGLSGPAVMDISRYYLDARTTDPGAHLTANFLPDHSRDSLDRELQNLAGRKPALWLTDRLPARLADTLCTLAGIDFHTTGASLTRPQRRALLDAICEHRLPVTRSRGFTHAETTAGGIPLTEINIKTMESRTTPGLFLCGEILDVDGRIGGFNFQWAWATGHIAGTHAAESLLAAAADKCAHK